LFDIIFHICSTLAEEIYFSFCSATHIIYANMVNGSYEKFEVVKVGGTFEVVSQSASKNQLIIGRVT
jgi:hypothetical protein